MCSSCEKKVAVERSKCRRREGCYGCRLMAESRRDTCPSGRLSASPIGECAARSAVEAAASVLVAPDGLAVRIAEGAADRLDQMVGRARLAEHGRRADLRRAVIQV